MSRIEREMQMQMWASSFLLSPDIESIYGVEVGATLGHQSASQPAFGAKP